MLGLSASATFAQDAPPPQDVSGPEISILIRNTIIALNQANITGNYTVLRDLGAGILQQNTAADLAAQFIEFRKQRLNLAPTVLFDAILDEKPKLTTDGALRLVGHFPTKPQEIIFDLTYFYEAGAWRIARMNVGARPAPAAGAKPAETVDSKPKPKETGQVPTAKPVPLPRVRPKP